MNMTQLPLREIVPARLVHDWEDFKRRLSGLEYGRYLFRGQCRSCWNLSTRVERLGVINSQFAERYALDSFRRKVHQFCQSSCVPVGDLEHLSLMQHHGAPTRLLDWTFSPYVASFFAFCDLAEKNDYCAVWCLDAKWLHDAAQTRIQKELGVNVDFLDFNDDDTFQDIIWNNRCEFVAPIRPDRMNEREGTQQGAFLCPGSVDATFEGNLTALGEVNTANRLQQFVVMGDLRAEVMTDLARMNITAGTLFPGLDGFARSLGHEIHSFGIPEMQARQRMRLLMAAEARGEITIDPE